MKKIFHILFFSILALSVFNCRKEPSYIGSPDPATNGPDLTTKITSSVSGFVTDENNAAVSGAAVNIGANSVSTDQYGYFEIRNVEVVKNAAVVTVTKPGYFKGIKTFIATANKDAFFRIKLIPKTNAGAINTAAGGEVVLANGLIVQLPANAVVVASTNVPYSGTVSVSSYWIDPTAGDLNEIMPGDLRGIDETGTLKKLITYGMAAVELTGSSGELLQIAEGKKATLTIPLPSAIASTAPSTIPLWSFNETNGLWKQEGYGTKNGNAYSGEVSHFSFWNYDMPLDYVNFNCTITDGSGSPIPYVAVKISYVDYPFNYTWGYTDSSGYVSGAIPSNTSLLMEVFSNTNCDSPLYSQNLNATTIDMSLGNIAINTANITARITGSVVDCAHAPVTNGHIIISYSNKYFKFPLSSTGTFDFSTLICNGGTQVNTVQLIGEDNAAQQQGTSLNYWLAPGTNTVGAIQACGNSMEEFVKYSVDGGLTFTNIIQSMPDTVWSEADPSLVTSVNGQNAVQGLWVSFVLNMDLIAGGINGIYLITFNCLSIPQLTNVVQSTVVGQFTEYGPVGAYMAGNFTADVVGQTTPVTYPVVCSFRVRRTF